MPTNDIENMTSDVLSLLVRFSIEYFLTNNYNHKSITPKQFNLPSPSTHPQQDVFNPDFNLRLGVSCRTRQVVASLASNQITGFLKMVCTCSQSPIQRGPGRLL